MAMYLALAGIKPPHLIWPSSPSLCALLVQCSHFTIWYLFLHIACRHWSEPPRDRISSISCHPTNAPSARLLSIAHWFAIAARGQLVSHICDAVQPGHPTASSVKANVRHDNLFPSAQNDTSACFTSCSIICVCKEAATRSAPKDTSSPLISN